MSKESDFRAVRCGACADGMAVRKADIPSSDVQPSAESLIRDIADAELKRLARTEQARQKAITEDFILSLDKMLAVAEKFKTAEGESKSVDPWLKELSASISQTVKDGMRGPNRKTLRQLHAETVEMVAEYLHKSGRLR